MHISPKHATRSHDTGAQIVAKPTVEKAYHSPDIGDAATQTIWTNF